MHILIGQSSIVFQFVQHCNIIFLAAITGEVGNKQEKYSGKVYNIVSGTKPSANTKLTGRRRRRRRRRRRKKILHADRPIRGSTRRPRRPKKGPNIFFQCSKMLEMIL